MTPAPNTCRTRLLCEPSPKDPDWRRYWVRMVLSDEIAAIVAEMPGVASAKVSERYSLWVRKAPVFDWAEIHPRVMELLRGCVV